MKECQPDKSDDRPQAHRHFSHSMTAMDGFDDVLNLQHISNI